MYNNIPTTFSSCDERIGLLVPFLLGGLSGGLISPFFYNGGYNPSTNYQQPYYNNYYYIPYPYYYRKK